MLQSQEGLSWWWSVLRVLAEGPLSELHIWQFAEVTFWVCAPRQMCVCKLHLTARSTSFIFHFSFCSLDVFLTQVVFTYLPYIYLFGRLLYHLSVRLLFGAAVIPQDRRLPNQPRGTAREKAVKPPGRCGTGGPTPRNRLSSARRDPGTASPLDAAGAPPSPPCPGVTCRPTARRCAGWRGAGTSCRRPAGPRLGSWRCAGGPAARAAGCGGRRWACPPPAARTAAPAAPRAARRRSGSAPAAWAPWRPPSGAGAAPRTAAPPAPPAPVTTPPSAGLGPGAPPYTHRAPEPPAQRPGRAPRAALPRPRPADPYRASLHGGRTARGSRGERRAAEPRRATGSRRRSCWKSAPLLTASPLASHARNILGAHGGGERWAPGAGRSRTRHGPLSCPAAPGHRGQSRRHGRARSATSHCPALARSQQPRGVAHPPLPAGLGWGVSGPLAGCGRPVPSSALPGGEHSLPRHPWHGDELGSPKACWAPEPRVGPTGPGHEIETEPGWFWPGRSQGVKADEKKCGDFWLKIAQLWLCSCSWGGDCCSPGSFSHFGATGTVPCRDLGSLACLAPGSTSVLFLQKQPCCVDPPADTGVIEVPREDRGQWT